MCDKAAQKWITYVYDVCAQACISCRVINDNIDFL